MQRKLKERKKFVACLSCKDAGKLASLRRIYHNKENIMKHIDGAIKEKISDREAYI